MSDHVPTTEEVRDSYAGHDFDQAIAGAQFDRWLAEVEREAAARALEAEAEALLKVVGINRRALFQEPAAAQMNRGIHLSAERLRARAEAYRQERGEQ